MCQKIAEKKAKQKVDEIEKVESICVEILEQINKALKETDIHEYSEVTTQKQVGKNAKGQPVEVTKQQKEFKQRKGKTNVSDLARIADALERIVKIHTGTPTEKEKVEVINDVNADKD